MKRVCNRRLGGSHPSGLYGVGLTGSGTNASITILIPVAFFFSNVNLLGQVMKPCQQLLGAFGKAYVKWDFMHSWKPRVERWWICISSAGFDNR